MSKDVVHNFSYQSLLPIPGRLTTSEVGGNRTQFSSPLKCHTPPLIGHDPYLFVSEPATHSRPLAYL